MQCSGSLRLIVVRWLAIFLLLLPYVGCAYYSRVKEKQPPPPVMLANSGIDRAIAEGLRVLEKQPMSALGHFLSAAEGAADGLRRDPADSQSLERYNYALSQAFAAILRSGVNVWEKPVQVSKPEGFFTLKAKVDSRHAERHPKLYDYYPASNLAISGTYVQERREKSGLGAPVVGIRREARLDARKRFALERGYHGVTAVARFRGSVCEMEFVDPLAAETVSLNSRSYHVAADFTAALALMLNDTNPRKKEIFNLVRPGDPADSARIILLQPFDPEKTTVLLVHGLISSPATWVPMLNELRGDAAIRKRYQFWLYEYPSGYPYPVSAALMRKELDAALREFPQKKPMILIGHSMGGLIARLMVTDPGERLWKEAGGGRAGNPVSILKKRTLLSDAFFFKSRPEVGRVLFIAVPHRGSDIAGGWIGRLGARLIRAPEFLAKASLEVATLGLIPGWKQRDHAPNSVDTLSSKHPFVLAINKIPIKPGVPVHSIIGDRGKGDTPNSSDGAVPYRSSHIDKVVSEKIVPSGHRAHQHPEAIAEVDRILKRAAR